MGNRLPASKPSRYVTSHPGQISLAILPWVDALSTSKSWRVKRQRDALVSWRQAEGQLDGD